ncbi:AAA family ATPase [Sediminicoccus sp. BL-A-41-H5]|uniref:AAA family ATPase n=1 Tax=Sediminicoccus sp. BL-A-41-H5 TaxID=3421106 RepID=UPI003D66EF71
MNAESPLNDLAECERFARFWMDAANAPHLTLTAISHRNDTETQTFGPSDLDTMTAWVQRQQQAAKNVYFTPNETAPGCTKKPDKASMAAALCRHADIDPLDDQFPLADERRRLSDLAEHLKADAVFPPSVLIDSGNGIQALWVAERRALSGVDDYAEAERQSQAIEAATGAKGTANIDRLLRLPGTINFPTGAKVKKGRPVTRARLIHTATHFYTAAEIEARLPAWAQRVEASGHVRKGGKAAADPATPERSAEASGSVLDALRKAGAARIKRQEDLPPDLAQRLERALTARERLGDRWAGMVDDLTEAGHDDSRSGADFSLAAMLKAAGFSEIEAGLILAAFAHGKANGDEWPNADLRLRHIARCVTRSYSPEVRPAAETPDLGDVMRFRLDCLTEGEPPPRRFLLEPLMPLGTVGLLFGEGGLGKSMVALDLALLTARATRGCGLAGRLPGPLGGTVSQEAAGASVFITLEDDKAELHRRANALDPHRTRDGVPCFVIPALDLPGFEPALVTTSRERVAVLTSFAETGLDALLTNISRGSGFPVRLLILDPAGDFLEGDENDAKFVQRLMRLLREKASAHGATILLLGHVAKGAGGTSMRGSGAWVANSRFAYSLRRPDPNHDKSAIGQFKRQHIEAERIVIGQLVKANHAGAPTYRDRFFLRCRDSGRLLDETQRLAPPAPDAALLDALVTACGECAAAGMPFKLTGAAGLFEGRADLPEPLASLPRAKLELLGNQSVEQGRLVKCRGPGSRAPDFLDVPEGPYAKGPPIVTDAGSRAEALAQYRAHGGVGAAGIIPAKSGNERE